MFKSGCGEACVKTTEALECFRAGADEDLAAVAGIAEAFDEAGFFEAVEDAGDGAGGQAGCTGELAGGERGLGITGHQFKASGISNIEAEFGGDGLVEEDGSGADLAAEVHSDSLNQCGAFDGLGGFFRRFHFTLTAKYLTN